MKRIRKLSILLVFCLAAIAMPAMVKTAEAAQGLTNESIEDSLASYSEPGYQYLEKLGVGMWKVLYARPDWRYGWEVIITTTSSNPENSILVIGTSLLAADSLNSRLMMKLLDENSYDNNPGNYSVFFEDDVYYVQYALKIPQMLMNEKALLEAIGFVAGYSNSKVKSIERLLYEDEPAEPQTFSYSTPAQDEPAARESQAAKPAPAAPAPSPSKPAAPPAPEKTQQKAAAPAQSSPASQTAPEPAPQPVTKEPAPQPEPEPAPVTRPEPAPQPTPAPQTSTVKSEAPDTTGAKTIMAKSYIEADGTISIYNTELDQAGLYIVQDGDNPIAEVMVTKVGFLSSKAKISELYVDELDKDAYQIGDRIVIR